jgi:hypothetical protein
MSGRKKTVSRKKGGGRRRTVSTGDVKKTPSSRKTHPRAMKKDERGNPMLKQTDAIQNPVAWDLMMKQTYKRKIPVFDIPEPFVPQLNVDGTVYTDTFLNAGNLGRAVNIAIMVNRTGYRTIIGKTTIEDSGKQVPHYRVYKDHELREFPIAPRDDYMVDKLRGHMDGGWSTPSNHILINTDNGAEPILLSDKLGQLKTNLSENKTATNIEVSARLEEDHISNEPLSGRHQRSADIVVKWDGARQPNDITALNIFTAFSETFGSDVSWVKSYTEASKRSGMMEVMVFNRWERGSGTFTDKTGYGVLSKLDAYDDSDFDP